MGQQINVNLGFTADTQQAKMAIQDLSNTLQKITLAPVGKNALFDDAEFKRASAAATELQGKIQAAFNQKTGKLDLLKFSTDLKTAGKDINYFKENLSGVGPLGTQAFFQLAQAIATSEAPMLRLSSRMKEFGTTLANTAKWQLSSSMMHGFMGTIEKAYGYAQNLNRSLNDIRIVSGQSADQMSKFADEANKAARALSATTLDYTNAALVYYQQGLNDKQVKERTDITIKMANVSQQSAETVSDQMTAVWNNFAKGSENLEHFADAMVRLGADTASSSDEIAEGLEKFAAIGDTVGLSFDNAAAALATVTATTRQSADVVGTAFKTLFARIQDLELGKTLDDGTTLGKYSEALEATGINIKNSAGELKDMDTILNEMGNKWTTLSKDSQVALAQTVAGTRQYTQLIALMDNFDFYQENLQRAINSDGSLQEQADIYAESWEAARDRVQAALENIYTKLIDDDFFINLSNGLAKVIDGVSGFIDGLGGVEGLLKSISSIFMSVYAQKMPEFLNNLKQNLMIITGAGQKEMLKMQTQTTQALNNMQSDSKISNTDKIKAEGISKVTIMQQKYIQNMRYMSDTEQQEYQAKMKNIQALYTEAEALEKAYKKMQKYQSRNARPSTVQRNLNQNRQRAEQELRAIENERQVLQEEKNRRFEEEWNKSSDTNSSRRRNRVNNIINREFEDRENEIAQRINTARAGVNRYNISSEDIVSRFNEASTDYYKASAESGTVSGIANSLSGQTSSWRAQKASIGENEQEIKKLETQMRNYLQTQQKIAKQNGFKEIEESLSQVVEQQKDANGQIEEIPKTIDIATASYEELLRVMDNASKAAEKMATEKSNIVMTAEDNVEYFRELIGDEAVSDVKRNADKIKENRENSVGADELRERPIEEPSGIVDTSQAFMSLAGAAMQAQTALSAVTSVMEIFNNENSTTSEKIGALIGLFSTVAFMIPQITQAYRDLRNSKLLHTLATKLQTTAIWGEVTANAALNLSFAATLAVIALLVGAIYLIVKAWKNYQANSPEGKLKAARESALALREELNKTKEAVDNIKSSFDNYKSIQEKLADCKKGTEDWNEALRDNNEQVKELIRKYPQLTGLSKDVEDEKTGKIINQKAISLDENGILSIQDWAIEIIIDEANILVTKAQLATDYGEQRVRENEIKILEKKINDLIFKGDTTGRRIIANQPDELEQSMIEESGHANRTPDGRYYTYDSTWIKDAADTLINKYGEEAEKYTSEIDGISEDQVATLKELISAELDLKGAIQENTNATLVEREAAASQIMEGYEPYEKSENKDYINKVIAESGYSPQEFTEKGEEYGPWWNNQKKVLRFDTNKQTFTSDDNGSALDKYNKQILEVLDGSVVFNDSLDREKLLNQYLQEKGYTDTQIAQKTWDKKSRNSLEYTIGEDQDIEVSYQLIADTLTAKIQEEMTRSFGEAMTDQVESFKSTEQKELFSFGVTGDGSILSSDTLKKDQKVLNETIDSMELADKTLKALGATEEQINNQELKNDFIKDFKTDLKDLVVQKKGFEAFAKTYDTNMDAIISNSELAGSAAKDMAKQLKAAFNFGAENLDKIITPEFIKDNQKLFDDFVNGVEGSYEELRRVIGEQIWVNIGLDATQYEQAYNKLNTLIENAYGLGIEDLQIGVQINDPGVIQHLADIANELINTGLTAEEAGQIIKDSMGFDIETVPVTEESEDTATAMSVIPHEVPLIATSYNPANMQEETVEYTGVEYELRPEKEKAPKAMHATAVKVKSAKYAGGGNVNRKPVVNKTDSGKSQDTGKKQGNGSGGKGGGGGSKPKVVQKKTPIEPKKAKDEIERYHEITKQIDNQSKLLDRLSKAKDAAYGPDKLKMMDKEIEATKTLIDLNKQHIKEIRENLKLDKERAKSYGITFDKNGLINNFDEIIQQKMDEWEVEQNAILAREYAYDAAKNADENYDADGSIKLAIELDKKAIDENYENFKDAISQYEETYELFNEKAAELAEKYREISQQELEKIQYKVQLKLDFNDLERQFIEVEQTLLGDGWEKFSEAVWLADQNIKTFTSDMEANKNGLISLLEQYNNGMDSAVFFEGAKELISNGLGNIKDILSADADMLNMYGDALDKANEEVSRWTDLIDAGTSKLDHFKELSSLLRKDEDNKWMNTILSAQQKTLNDRYNVSKNQFEMLKGEYNALYDRWNREKDTLPEKELEMLETKLYAAVSAMNEAEDQMLSDLEAVGEKAQEILENNISKAQKKLEKNLFGDTYENYMDQIDKLNLKQEEYLTNTNKMYETNKLIRQAQQDIDKTNNNRAKQQYNDYVKYIEQLQESGKLSNYELSIAQARYEVLKAQIALEDAKDAKDQVRLTRDSEGNFGYVYTANQDKVESAQQNFEDAQNKLYNIGLDGAKDYQAKSAEIYEKWQSEMQNIQEQYQSGQIASESEFREKQKEITTYYQGLLKQYNELYYTGYDLLVEESYDNTADYMLKGITSVGDFKDATSDYLSDIRRYYKDYDSTVEEIEETVGSNLSSLKKKTGEVTTNTENLSNMITDKLLPAMSDELEAVRVKTSEYGAQRDAIWEVIEATRELLRLTQKNEMSVLSGNIDDYSLKIRDLLIEGKDENSPLVQQAIANRNSKMNGYDPYDYQAMMDEEAAKNGTNTAWYRTLALLRKQKLLNTDWMGKYNENPEANSWALDVREESMGIDFAQQLINLGNAFPGITTDDDRVRNILNKRKAKLMDLEAKGTNLSGYEPIASLLKRANIIDVSRDGYSPTALYNTGGYTGAWGPEGKLAVLHEKELVLNAQDTENILSSVNILRQISQALDNSAVWASLGLGGLNAASIGTLADQTLQQEVHISADFPNVTDHNEIEMAIDNLINAASQYAYRK